MIPDHSEELPTVFESTEVEWLVGISSIRLNKFLERKLYGLRPSIKAGIGRGRRRLFSREDVFGIALVWWLFQAGLRSPVIQDVLDNLAGRKHASANTAAAKLEAGPARGLLIQRRQRTPADKRLPRCAVVLTRSESSAEAAEAIVRKDHTTIFVPTGALVLVLKDAMQDIGG